VNWIDCPVDVMREASEDAFEEHIQHV